MEWYPKLCCNLKAPKAKKKCVPCSTGVTCQGRASHHQTSGLKHHCSENPLNRVTLYNTFPNVSIKHNRAALESPNIVWQLRPSRTRPLSPMLSRLRRTRSSVPERKLKGWPQHHGGLFFFFFSSRTVQYAEVVLRALDTLIAFRVLIRIQITVWRHKFE